MTSTLGTVVYAFFTEYLADQKGLRPTSIRSYRDALRLFLLFVTADARRPISELRIEDLTFERVLGFLQHLEGTRHNQIVTRNHRLTALRIFFEYVGRRIPELLHVCERVAAIPTKRTPLPEMRFMDRHEIRALFAHLPREGRYAVRDDAILLLLYNTGARVQEIADLRIEHVTLTSPAHVRLHGKGDKWRTCPLWDETVRVLRNLLDQRRKTDPTTPVFASDGGRPLTRFGIYKRVRLHGDRRVDGAVIVRSYHAACLPAQHSSASPRSRRGGQRDSRVAWTRQPGDDESVRGNHCAHERGSDETM